MINCPFDNCPSLQRMSFSCLAVYCPFMFSWVTIVLPSSLFYWTKQPKLFNFLEVYLVPFSCTHLSWTYLYWKQITRNAPQYSRWCSDIWNSCTMDSALNWLNYKYIRSTRTYSSLHVYSQRSIIYSRNHCYFHLILQTFIPFCITTCFKVTQQ